MCRIYFVIYNPDSVVLCGRFDLLTCFSKSQYFHVVTVVVFAYLFILAFFVWLLAFCLWCWLGLFVCFCFVFLFFLCGVLCVYAGFFF